MKFRWLEVQLQCQITLLTLISLTSGEMRLGVCRAGESCGDKLSSSSSRQGVRIGTSDPKQVRKKHLGLVYSLGVVCDVFPSSQTWTVDSQLLHFVDERRSRESQFGRSAF